jgi:RHS repeat-associated protein
MQLAAARSDAPFPKPLRESSGHRVLGDDPWVVEAARRGGRYGIKAYTAREWDPETGLYYYRARYYDPRIGRFISEDPIGLSGGQNLYAYANNSPLGLGDPFGLCPPKKKDCFFYLITVCKGCRCTNYWVASKACPDEEFYRREEVDISPRFWFCNGEEYKPTWDPDSDPSYDPDTDPDWWYQETSPAPEPGNGPKDPQPESPDVMKIPQDDLAILK